MKSEAPRDGGASSANGSELFEADDTTCHPGLCDFCTAPGPRWLYPCQSFTIGVLRSSKGTETHFSTGAWAACDACHAAIERGDYERIVRRYSGSVRMVLRSVYRRFEAHRLGDAYEVSQ